ncbi:MAG: hypothetical protein PVJ72_01180 [Gammaproteobacteria bacterium]
MAHYLLYIAIKSAFADGGSVLPYNSSLAMNPYFKVDITSTEEEQQHVAKFLKILNSLGEHAASFLFQKGVVLGDDSYNDYDQQLSDSKFRESITNILLRPNGKEPDKDTYCLVAVLLFNMSNEAVQLFSDIKTRPRQIGTSSCIIALGHIMALIDRATAFLNLPSVNDKGYWRLMTMQAPVQPVPTQSTPVKPPPSQSPTIQKSQTPPLPAKKPAPPVVPLQPQTTTPSVRASVEKAISSPPTLETLSPIPELSPIQSPKQPVKHKAAVNTVTPAPKATPSKDTKKPVAKNKKKAEPVKHENSASDSNKPEGPIKAMLRRIAEEIHDNSYEAIIEALKDKTLMTDLYNAPNNPISVKITEVNTKERTIYLIKQKRGAPEPVTFRLIRKLIAELQL